MIRLKSNGAAVDPAVKEKLRSRDFLIPRRLRRIVTTGKHSKPVAEADSESRNGGENWESLIAANRSSSKLGTSKKPCDSSKTRIWRHVVGRSLPT